MWIFICILLVIGILSAIFLFQNKGKEPATGRKGIEKKKPPRPRPQFVPALDDLPKEGELVDTGILRQDPESPTGPETLEKRIQNGIRLIFADQSVGIVTPQSRLRLEDVDPAVRTAVLGQIKQLKAFRSTYDLYQALDDPKTDMSTLSKSIVTDPILSGKILRAANSAYFGLQQRINSIGHAIMIIGILNLKHILYQDYFRQLAGTRGATETVLQNRLWEHATLTSICALHTYGIFNDVDRGTIFTLGLLQDVGKYVLMGLDPIKKIKDGEERQPLSKMAIQEEYQVYGINHVLIGRLIFEEWGFSDLMIKICEMHHEPSRNQMESLGLNRTEMQYLLVLFLSDQIAKLFGSEEGGVSPIWPIDPTYRTMIQKERLSTALMDPTLFLKIQKARTLMKSYV
jgi:HD-like signal output (HDOD) protein